MGPKNFDPKKKLKKNLVQKIWGLKKLGFEKIVGLRQFWVRRKFEFEIFFGSNKISGLKTLGPNKILCLEKFCPKKLGQNRTSKS